MNLICPGVLAYFFYFGLYQVMLQCMIVPVHSHPQPCRVLAQVGHTVRLGVLLPSRRPTRVRAALDRALSAMAESGNHILPYNLSLDVVAREPADGDPESLFRCLCQSIVVQGVSAVLAFPQSKDELLQVEFMSSFLEIPFVSIIEHGEPLQTEVKCFMRFPIFLMRNEDMDMFCRRKKTV